MAEEEEAIPVEDVEVAIMEVMAAAEAVAMDTPGPPVWQRKDFAPSLVRGPFRGIILKLPSHQSSDFLN